MPLGRSDINVRGTTLQAKHALADSKVARTLSSNSDSMSENSHVPR